MQGALMRTLLWALCCASGLAGCAYITRDEFLEQWDEDGDGWPTEEDCGPKDPDYYPYAPDIRGDGCDHDCGTEPDRDGDDFPDAADCDPDDPTIYPCSPYEIEGDDIDHDCDTQLGVRTDTCSGADPDYPDVSVSCTPDEGDEP